MIFLPFHPTILKPDFDLPLGQVERVSDLYPAAAGEVAVEVELLLELQDLVSSVGRPLPLRLAPGLELPVGWGRRRGLVFSGGFFNRYTYK